MAKEMKSVEELVSDAASQEMLRKAEEECIETCFTRGMHQSGGCKFGREGICCRICHMGPCRITPRSPKGVCGADADTIVARNFLREVVGGASAHSDHGRHLALMLRNIGEGHESDYKIKDENALRLNANRYGIETEGRAKEEIAKDLGQLFVDEFSRQEEKLKTLSLAPLKRQGIWENLNLEPKGIDRMAVEAMHRTHMGVDHDYKHLLDAAFRTSLSDGWGGSRIATIVSDILFGTPEPVRGTSNLGVLCEDTVNVIVHGHEPAMSEMLAEAVNDPEVAEAAKAAGAKGITLAGMCCTSNEIMMRHGIPSAGNFLQQELAIITGAVEMMAVDVQCCMPSLPEVASYYHTEVVSTSDIARTVGATHISFDEENAYKCAVNILKRAADNFKNRDPKKVRIPSESKPLVAGFSVEAIKYMLGGSFRASFRPLNDAIIQNRIKGVVGIVGCNNVKSRVDDYINSLALKLIENNVLVLKTGCAAHASAKIGALTPETALEHAGKGLKEVCEAVGMPPILHMGSCVDNCRILEAATEIVLEGGLGEDLAQVPAVGVAPEWMSEKAVSIGCYFVASGCDVILGQPFNTAGSENVTKYLNEEVRETFGGSFHDAPDADTAFEITMKLLDDAREKLGINRQAERKLYDMKDRRSLDV